ncbi:MAG TPA: hypothetical protein VHU19_17200 [Pyrinomonadaceae bacterium]|nr:hypothetical protein [Pyrinomonadaceae bacterium]
MALNRPLPGAATQALAVEGEAVERGRGAGAPHLLGPTGHALLEARAVKPFEDAV